MKFGNKKTHVIINPVSGGKRGLSVLEKAKPHLENHYKKNIQYHVTTEEGHATEIVKNILQGNSHHIIVIGGDGTLNEAINGMMALPKKDDNVCLGILPSGSGCDFIRSLKIEDNIEKSIGLIVSGKTREIDLGKISYHRQGIKQTKHFLNIASFGAGGHIVNMVNSRKKILGNTLSYLGALAINAVTYNAQKVKLQMEQTIIEKEIMNVFVCNGAYSGKGMLWAPDANLDDGLLDIVVVEKMPLLKQMVNISKLYDGSIIGTPGVHHFKANKLIVESTENVLIEMDGEQPGVLPAEFGILPRRLRVFADKYAI